MTLLPVSRQPETCADRPAIALPRRFRGLPRTPIYRPTSRARPESAAALGDGDRGAVAGVLAHTERSGGRPTGGHQHHQDAAGHFGDDAFARFSPTRNLRRSDPQATALPALPRRFRGLPRTPIYRPTSRARPESAAALGDGDRGAVAGVLPHTERSGGRRRRTRTIRTQPVILAMTLLPVSRQPETCADRPACGYATGAAAAISRPTPYADLSAHIPRASRICGGTRRGGPRCRRRSPAPYGTLRRAQTPHPHHQNAAGHFGDDAVARLSPTRNLRRSTRKRLRYRRCRGDFAAYPVRRFIGPHPARVQNLRRHSERGTAVPSPESCPIRNAPAGADAAPAPSERGRSFWR